MLRVKNDKPGIYPRVKSIMVNYKIRTQRTLCKKIICYYGIMISDLQKLCGLNSKREKLKPKMRFFLPNMAL